MKEEVIVDVIDTLLTKETAIIPILDQSITKDGIITDNGLKEEL
jgi:hypothetical protein